MGASLSITQPTAEQLQGVSQICIKNENAGLIMEMVLEEERPYYNVYSGGGTGWYPCEERLYGIAVHQTRCVDLRKCQRNREGRDAYRVTFHQAYLHGDTEVFEREFTYSDFGKTVTFEITGTTVFDAEGEVVEVASRKPPPHRCVHNSCYVSPIEWLNHEEAQTYCEDREGHLAYIGSEEENLTAKDVLRDTWETGGWIGMHEYNGNQHGGQEFSAWLDGSNVGYENWAPGQPNGAGPDKAVQMLQDGQWGTKPETDDNAFVCEIPDEKIGNHRYH